MKTKEEWSELQIRLGLDFLSGKPTSNIDDSIFGLSHLIWRGCPGIKLWPVGPNNSIRAEYIVGVIHLNGLIVDDDLVDCVVQHVLHRSRTAIKPKTVLRFRRDLVKLFSEVNNSEKPASKRLQKRIEEIKQWRKAAAILDIAS